MSRLNHAHAAIRPALKARALLSGPPGSGKTRTGLIVATHLAAAGEGRVLVIDTEKESALTYADDFTFDHLRWDPPFDPRDLASTITDAGHAYDAIQVDSLTHFWRGDGGVLSIADGKYTGWKDARPAHADMVEAILRCDAHIVLCARAKVAHEQVQERGKWVVKKLGLQVVQDDDLEYEINVHAELDMDHSMVVAKSRTVAVPVGRTYSAGHAEQFAADYAEWLAGGEEPAPAEVIEAFRERVAALPDGTRGDCKAAYFAALGRPDTLRPSQVADAERIVASFEALTVRDEGEAEA